MTIEIPDNYRGKPIKGAMERLRQSGARAPEAQPTPTLATGKDTSDYILVPETGIYMGKQRVLLNKDWNETQEELKAQDLHMPTPHQMRAFLKHLRDGSRNNPEYQRIFEDITQVRDPLRSNWLNARFEERSLGLLKEKARYMISENPLNAPKETKLEDFLASDKSPGISLDSWLDSPKPHGLPQSNTPDGSFYYWAPRNGAVARLVANSLRAYLNCGGGSSIRNGSLGIALSTRAEVIFEQ